MPSDTAEIERKYAQMDADTQAYIQRLYHQIVNEARDCYIAVIDADDKPDNPAAVKAVELRGGFVIRLSPDMFRRHFPGRELKGFDIESTVDNDEVTKILRAALTGIFRGGGLPA